MEYTLRGKKFSEDIGIFFIFGLKIITLLKDRSKARESQCTCVRRDVNTELSIGE